jgi:hypothetical protein
MTRTQWLFEFSALKQLDQEKIKYTEEMYKAITKTAIQLLGLNVAAFADDYDGTQEKIVPLTMLAGNHHMMPRIMEMVKKQDEIAGLAQDSDINAISESIANDIGDLDPILYGDLDMDKAKYVNSEDFKQALKSMGVKPYEWLT